MAETVSTPPADLQRAADLAIARCAADAVAAAEESFFVLTGSYSIEALTRGNVVHNDVDANVFTLNVPRAVAQVGLLLGTGGLLHNATRIENTKPSRLEYAVESPAGTRALELRFIEFAAVRGDEGERSFLLSGDRNRDVVVPTVQRSLTDPSGEARDFTVKSLPFAIATWALRISGMVEVQKRPVRQSDINHFAFLVECPHITDEVLHAMNHHPQMPKGVVAADAFQRALCYTEN